MSTPNPLVPQGTFQSQAGKGASNVRIAVATIIAIHIVFFGGLLLQGCKRDTKVGSISAETNTAATNLSLPPIEPSSLFYTNANSLPPEPSNNVAVSTPQVPVIQEPAPVSNIREWQSTNLGTLTTSATPVHPGTGSGETKEYTVVARDTFAKIAAANGTTVNALKKANPTVDPAKIRPGMKLQVPVGAPAGAATQTASKSPTGDVTGATAPSANTYKVKAGDTLTKVAKAHGITVAQLRSANNLKTSGLKAGQTLKIPAPDTQTSTKHTNAPSKTVVSKGATNPM